MNTLSPTGHVEVESPEPFVPTMERLVAAIHQAGLQIFARIDHAAAARESGLQMPPTTVLVYGHAKGGTPIMLAAPNAALDLPLRVLVREGPEGHVFVSIKPIASMLRALDVSVELIDRLQPSQLLIINAVKSRSP